MFRIMEYEKRIEVKNFKEFHRISETKEKFNPRINPGRYIRFSPARIMFVWDFPTLKIRQGSVGNCY